MTLSSDESPPNPFSDKRLGKIGFVPWEEPDYDACRGMQRKELPLRTSPPRGRVDDVYNRPSRSRSPIEGPSPIPQNESIFTTADVIDGGATTGSSGACGAVGGGGGGAGENNSAAKAVMLEAMLQETLHSVELYQRRMSLPLTNRHKELIQALHELTIESP